MKKAIPLRFNSYLLITTVCSLSNKEKTRPLLTKVDEWFTGDEAQILISTLEEELSTRFT